MYSPSGLVSRIMNISPVQRQSLIVFSSTVGTTLVGFLSTIFFAHMLGPAPLGTYFLFLAYFGIFNLIGDGGFGGAAVKRISEGNEQDEYFSAFVATRIVLLALSVTALLCAEPYLNDITSSGIFFWLLVALVVAVLPGCASTGVYGSGKVGIHQVSVVVDLLVRVLLQVAAVYAGYSFAGLAGGFLGGLIAGGIANFRYLDRRLVRFRACHVKNLTSFSFWIFLTSSGALIFSYTDTILIGLYLNNAEVGIYRTALQLASVGSFATLAFQTVLFPKISSWAAESRTADIENALARACTYSLVLAVPTCVGGWILGDRLLYYLYGASFTSGTIPFIFLLFTQIVNIFMFLGTMCLNSLDRPREAFAVTLVASVANIGLNMAFIPVWGITGAAVATLIAMALNAAGAYMLLSRIIRVKIETRPIRNILCAAGAMALFLLAVPIAISLNHVLLVMVLVAIGGGLYGLVLLKLDTGIRGEIREIGLGLGLPWPAWL